LIIALFVFHTVPDLKTVKISQMDDYGGGDYIWRPDIA